MNTKKERASIAAVAQREACAQVSKAKKKREKGRRRNGVFLKALSLRTLNHFYTLTHVPSICLLSLFLLIGKKNHAFFLTYQLSGRSEVVYYRWQENHLFFFTPYLFKVNYFHIRSIGSTCCLVLCLPLSKRNRFSKKKKK